MEAAAESAPTIAGMEEQCDGCLSNLPPTWGDVASLQTFMSLLGRTSTVADCCNARGFVDGLADVPDDLLPKDKVSLIQQRLAALKEIIAQYAESAFREIATWVDAEHITAKITDSHCTPDVLENFCKLALMFGCQDWAF